MASKYFQKLVSSKATNPNVDYVPLKEFMKSESMEVTLTARFNPNSSAKRCFVYTRDIASQEKGILVVSEKISEGHKFNLDTAVVALSKRPDGTVIPFLTESQFEQDEFVGA